MKKLAIKAENISKQYRLGEIGTGTLSHDLNRFWHQLQGKENPYLKIGDINDRTVKGESDYVWSLRDINFEIEQGDIVGIIGRNGAGKSTLLKLLSKVSTPTTGGFKVNGRIASLLEVGTGFNPLLTGKENIYLNGAILGMRKHEITRKLDEIIDFSGVERYIDTPVKRYSSGMYVRLAFAVAAHLESEILIVDEVLAVGDAEFQKKCLGKMGDVSKADGRTILFVSHNMSAVKSLCNNGIILENGNLIYEGDIESAVGFYLKGENEGSITHKIFEIKEMGVNHFWIQEIGVKSKLLTVDDPISENDDIEIFIRYVYKERNENRLDFNLKFKSDDGTYIFNSSTGFYYESTIEFGEHLVSMSIPAHFFAFGTYYMDLMLVQDKRIAIFEENDIVSFTINPKISELGSFMGKGKTFLKPKFDWVKQS